MLAHRILRDGRLVQSLDAVLRVRFEVRALQEYFDTRLGDIDRFLEAVVRWTQPQEDPPHG